MKKQKYITVLLFFSLGLNAFVPADTNAGMSALPGNIRWMQVGGDIDGEAAGDESGTSVSMPDARTVATGAPEYDGNGTEAGHVRVFSWDGSHWVQKGSDIHGEVAGDNSGWSVSMPDAYTVAVGSPGNDGNGDDAGHVRVFSWDGSQWVQRGGDIDGEATSDLSGWSVSMPDAHTVAVGALFNDGNGEFAGQVRVFSWDGSRWEQKGFDIDGETAGDWAGWSVSMPDANTVAVGASMNDGNGKDAGHVRVFSWDGSRWVQKGGDIDGEAEGDVSGVVCMPDAHTLAVGARLNEGNGPMSGHVRVFSWDGSRWVQRGGDIDGEAANDVSGMSVSMPDAHTVAIGAEYNDGNGHNAGHVRVFSWDGSRWVQKGGDVDGEAVADISGVVSMPDAHTVAVGASWNDGNGHNAGHVRVYTVYPR